MPKRTPRGRLQFEHQEEAVNQDGEAPDAAVRETLTLSVTLLLRRTVLFAPSPLPVDQNPASDSSFADAVRTHRVVRISHRYTCRHLTSDEKSALLHSVFQALDGGGAGAEGVNEHEDREQNEECIHSSHEHQEAGNKRTHVPFGTTPREKRHMNSASREVQDKRRPSSGPFPQLRLAPLLEVECFADDRDACLPYYERQAHDALAFFDDYLPHDPVHVVKLGQSFRLSVHLSGDQCLGSALVRIVSVFVTPPDGDGQSLDIVQWRDTDDCSVSAFAHLDPTQFASGKLNAVSPCFGLVDRKYVKLSVCTTVLLGSGCVREAVLNDALYFKVVHCKDRMRLHRFLGMFVTKEEKRCRQKRTLHQ